MNKITNSKLVLVEVPIELHGYVKKYQEKRNQEIRTYNIGRDLIMRKISLAKAVLELTQKGIASLTEDLSQNKTA